MDKLQGNSKGRREPVGIDYIFEFHIPDERYKSLLLFVPNFNTTSDENGFIDQSYPLLFKVSLWDFFRVSISRKNDKES